MQTGSCCGSLLINSQGMPTVTSTLLEDPCRNQTRRQWHLEFQKGNLADRRNSSSQLCKYFSNVLNIFTLSAAMLKQHHGAGNTNCAVWMTPFQRNREVFVETTELNWTLHQLLKHKKKANVLPVVWKTAYDCIPRGKLWEVLQDYKSRIPSYCRLWNPFTGCVKTAPGSMSTFLTDLKAREESITRTLTGNTTWFCYQSILRENITNSYSLWKTTLRTGQRFIEDSWGRQSMTQLLNSIIRAKKSSEEILSRSYLGKTYTCKTPDTSSATEVTATMKNNQVNWVFSWHKLHSRDFATKRGYKVLRNYPRIKETMGVTKYAGNGAHSYLHLLEMSAVLRMGKQSVLWI